jgi:hypothetical protein
MGKINIDTWSVFDEWVNKVELAWRLHSDSFDLELDHDWKPIFMKRGACLAVKKLYIYS